MVSPRGAGALGPDTQANCLENQPVTFKGESNQGQHQIPAVPLLPTGTQLPNTQAQTSTFLDSSLFPATDI